MNAPNFENLDLACAKTGQEIAAAPSKELENLVTSVLGVLEEQGLYALFLFLKAQTGKNKEMANGISDKLFKKIQKVTSQQACSRSNNSNNDDVFAFLQQIANDLDKLLLARDLVRQTLVYARYHARLPQKSEVQT